MSSVKSGKTEIKSKIKTVLTSLEKLRCSSNNDREQTRYLCHRLLQLVNNQDTSKRDVTSKAGLDIILLTLESCSDQATCMALVSTLAQLANEGNSSAKRLVSHDTTRVLLRTLAVYGSDLDWRLMSAIITLLSKLGPKDRRFALRARLTGSLPMILTVVRSTYIHHSHVRLMPVALSVLKLCVTNSSTNANLLGRVGAVSVLCKVCSSLSKKHPIPLKSALATLNLIIRNSKKNASQSIGLGLMSQMITTHKDYHRSDFRSNRHIAIRKSLLNIIKNMAVLKSGRRSFAECGGMLILHDSCKDYLAASACNNKAVDSLLSVAILIVRRCVQKRRLAVTNCHSSFRFPLQGRERSDSLSSNENIAEESEDDDFEEEDMIGDNGEAEESAQRASSSSSSQKAGESTGLRTPVVRSHEDLKMYVDFFPELASFQDNLSKSSQGNIGRPHSSGETTSKPRSKVIPTRHSFSEIINNPLLPHLSNAESTNSWEIPITLNVARLNLSDTNSNNNFGIVQGVSAPLVARQPSPRTNKNGLDERIHHTNPYNAWDQSTYSGESQLSNLHLPHIEINQNYDQTHTGLLHHQSHEKYSQGINDEHGRFLARVRDKASRTVSAKQNPNTLSYADQWGASPPPKLEHQANKKFVQRLIKTKLLEDIDRYLHPEQTLNITAYSSSSSNERKEENRYVNGNLYHCQLHQPENHIPACSTVTIPTGLEHDVRLGASNTEDTTSSATFSEDTWPGVYMEGQGTTETDNMIDQEEGVAGGVADMLTPTLKFDSNFESGNLRHATRVRDCEYDLILNSDCNSNHHHQWFYFSVSQMKTGRTYRFNIVNCEKKGSVFNEGMQPVMYSMEQARMGKPWWRRSGKEVCYYRNHFLKNSMSAGGGYKNKTYFTLTFTVTFQHDDDLCFFAYHYPYTYTKLKMDIESLLRNTDESSVFVRQQTLCDSLSGNPLPLLTITAQPRADEFTSQREAWEEMRSRPYIFLSARVHPGESNASWTMLGTLQLLLTPPPGEDAGMDDDAGLAAVADELRRSYIFKIVPMLNPDGVINGHHRCSLSGEDLNRTWLDPDPSLFPTIFHTKGLLQYLHSIHKSPLVYCDYHGHSRKMNVFLYGCSHKESVAAGEGATVMDGPDDTGYRALPRLLNHFAPSFSIKNCSFVVEKAKVSTARVVVWREMAVARSYTMESTYCGCDQGIYRGHQLSTRELEEMGVKFIVVLLHLKARNKTRGLPVFDIDDDASNLQNANNADAEDDSANPLMSPGCPVNSDAELTPDEDELSPVDTSFFFPALGDSPRSFNYNEEATSSKFDAKFWRYEADFDDDPILTAVNPIHRAEVTDPVPMTSGNLSDGVKDDRGHLPVIKAKVSPDTGRLLTYEYLSDDAVATAPKPFESGLFIRREKAPQKPAEQISDELLITALAPSTSSAEKAEGKTARSRRRSLKRSQS